jgi:hypothetical protein
MRTGGTTILCLEDRKSHFAASQQLHGSNNYDLVTATNMSSASAALRSIPSIKAAVLPYGENTPEQQIKVAAALETVRPGIPKVVISRLVARDPTLALLHLSYVESLQVLTLELGKLIAETRDAATLRQ